MSTSASHHRVDMLYTDDFSTWRSFLAEHTEMTSGKAENGLGGHAVCFPALLSAAYRRVRLDGGPALRMSGPGQISLPERV